MLDLTSIMIIAGVFLGLVVGDATVFGDPLRLEISVPPAVAATGFTDAAAEDVFSAHVSEMGKARSLVPTPSVQRSSRPPILASLAKPLHLDGVVVAVQSRVGGEVVAVRGVMLSDPAAGHLEMVTVVRMPQDAPVQLKLKQDDGDATALVRRSAEATMEVVSPYRLALTQFSQGLAGDPALIARAKDVASRAVARSWVPARATEEAMLHSLLATMALLEGDHAAVEAHLNESDQIPGVAGAAHGLVAFNRSFLAVAARQPEEAAIQYETARRLTAGYNLPGWDARLSTLGALVAWSSGDLTKAEALLRSTIADLPEDEVAHTYLAKVLAARGDAAGAAAERQAAANFRRFDIDYPALPLSMFWVDPVHGGLTRREAPAKSG